MIFIICLYYVYLGLFFEPSGMPLAFACMDAPPGIPDSGSFVSALVPLRVFLRDTDLPLGIPDSESFDSALAALRIFLRDTATDLALSGGLGQDWGEELPIFCLFYDADAGIAALLDDDEAAGTAALLDDDEAAGIAALLDDDDANGIAALLDDSNL